MIIKTERATWIPALDDPAEDVTNHGWLDLNGEIWTITNLHQFDDLGGTLDTLTIEKDGETKEIYSYDELETFTFDVY